MRSVMKTTVDEKEKRFSKITSKKFFFRSKPEISSVRNKRYISFIFFHVLQTFFIFLSLTEVRKNYVNEVIKYNTVDTYLLRQHASRSITKPAETHLPCLKTSRLNDWKWLRLSRNGDCWKKKLIFISTLSGVSSIKRQSFVALFETVHCS